MNRNYKVIWNRSLGCFTAVAEYAKSRGKSSKSSVSSNATINTTSNLSSMRSFRTTTIWLGLITAGFSMQVIAAPCTGAISVECGTNATASLLQGVAIGKNATAQGSQAIAIGGSSNGQSTTASGEQSIAIGANVVSSGNSSIAIGGDDLDAASENGVNNIFKGYTGKNLIEDPASPYDGYTQSNGAASVAIGVKARSEGALSTAVGVRSSSTGAASSAFGMGSSASKNGSVALGAGSTTLTDATTETTMSVGGKNYNVAGQAANTGAQVSVGSAGKERQIKHVAAGAVNKDSTDAVNGSQLHATNTVVNKGFGLKAADGNTVMKPLGEQVEVVGSNSNITTKVVGDKIAVALNNNLDLGAAGSVTMGKAGIFGLGPVTTVNSLGVFTGNVLGSTAVTGAGISLNGPLGIPSTTLTTNGLNIIGGPSVTKSGIDAGNKRIIRVSNGIDPTDAVNVSQLATVNNTVNRGLDFIGDNTGATSVITRKPGDALKVTGGNTVLTNLSDDNIGVIADNTTNTLTVKLAKNIDLGAAGSVTVGNTTINNSGFTNGNTLINGNGLVIYNNSGRDPVRLTATGLKNGGNKIEEVADGTNKFDAVNFGQLEATNNAVNEGINFGNGTTANNFKLGDTISVTGDANLTTDTTAEGVQVKLNKDIDLSADGSVTVGNTTISNNGFRNGNTLLTGDGLAIFNDGSRDPVRLTATGLKNGGNKIEEVADGTNKFDAVNFGQLEGVSNVAGSAMRNVITQIDGVTVKTLSKDDNKANFVTGSNILLEDDGLGGIKVSTAQNLLLNSVTMGNTIVNRDGLSFIGGSTVSVKSTGINAGGEVITGVANGTMDDHAVNYGQLQEVKNAAANANKGWDISTAGGTATNVAPGKVVDFNSKDTNITVSKNVTSDETSVSFELNKDLNLDSATFGDVKLSTSGLDNGGKTITNVGDGEIKAGSKDAINGGQINQVISDIGSSTSVLAEQMDAGLNFGADTGTTINKKLGDSALNFKGGNNITTTAVGSSIEFDLNGEISLDKVITGNTSMNNSGVTIIGGPNQSVILNNEGLNNGGNKITNVADGMAPRDAVNFGQLDAVSRNLGNSINELGYRIGEVEDDANAGISAAMAMSSLPQAYIIGKSMIGGGIANYNGESAVAIGFSKLSDDGRWVMKLNGTADTQGNVGAAIGAGFHFD